MSDTPTVELPVVAGPPAPSPAPSPGPTTPRARPSARTCLAGALVALVAVLVLLPDGLPSAARWALFAFGAATVLWTLTPLSPAYVALLAAAVATVPAGDQQVLLASLGHDVVWLIVGAFVLGGALAQTGLAGRLTSALVARARTVGGLCWLLTAALVPLAFLVPSTSGRAAVMLPVHRGLAAHLGDRQVTRALSLLIPTVVLVSTTITLVGATSHLVAVDLLDQVTGERISFVQWVLWGLPFGLVVSALACLAVQRLFLTAEQRGREVPRTEPDRTPLSSAERTAGLVVLGALALWMTEPLHGLEIATVTVAAALLLTAPRIGVLSWSEGLDHVSWTMVLFVAGALALGTALVDSGAGDWIVSSLFAATSVDSLGSPLALVVVISLLSVTAHLYVTSHTVRAVALVPPFLYLASALGLDPVTVVFIVTIGLDYCLTLPVSSKALLVFAEADGADRADGSPGGDGFTPPDLLRLSAVLLPAYVAAMVMTYVLWWQWTGLAF